MTNEPQIAKARPPQIAVTGMSAGGRGGVSLWLPLPFLATGALASAIFGLMAPFVAPLALVAYNEPRVLALVHIVTLGWLTMTIMGASLQLAPVILRSGLHARRLAFTLYPMFVVGVTALVCGFWFQRGVLLIVGGSVIVATVAHYVVIMGATLARAASRPLTAWYLTAAIGYLCVVVSLGLTAALDLQFDFLPTGFARLLLAHITIGVIGWLTCTLLGVSYTLVRMFALVHNHTDRLGRLIFALLNVGVVGLAASSACDVRWGKALCGGVLVVAVWMYAYDYWRMLRLRQRRVLDTTQRHASVAVVYLTCVLPLAVGAAVFGCHRTGILMALALSVFVGWLGQTAIGYLYKIVPFLVWQSRYAPLVGKTKVPLMRDLVQQQWATATFWLLNCGLLGAVVASALAWTLPLRFSCVVFGAGLVLAAANVIRAIAPKGSEQTRPTFAE
ncbi:MAG TPA: hypothetical protein VJN88_16045 [Ktedonobacterales bacterium]|nr:hypothetical protein [Ktedonobacterales bacterium]